MSIVPTSAKCDGCGKSRIEDSNHWLTIYIAQTNQSKIIVVEGIKSNGQQHACGLQCALQLFSEWFNKEICQHGPALDKDPKATR